MKLLSLLSLVIGVSFASLGSQASAQNLPDRLDTGNDFLRLCGEGRGLNIETAQNLMCTSYVRGVADGTGLFTGRYICLPAGVDVTQLINVSLSHMRANPDRTHQDVTVLILASWIKSFPCPLKAPSK